MTTRRPSRAAGAAVLASLVLGACGGGTTTTQTAESRATDSDLVAMAVKISELERRVDRLENGGELPEGEAGHGGTGSHGTGTDAGHAETGHDTTGESSHGETSHDTATDETGDDTGHDDTAHDDTAHGEKAGGAGHGDGTHWGYADAEHWGELAAEFATCSTGMEQSPIDLTQAEMTSIPDAELAYVPGAATVTDNGHTVQVNLTGAGSATVDGTAYELVQFHFHAPSEHTVDGVHSPVEAHFVHRDADGNLAVIGVMIVEGEPHPMFDEILASIPGKNEEVPLGSPVDARTLMPSSLLAYRYPGSLTTPPCTEGVTWSVLVEPITWSAEQVTALAAHFSEPNNRPQQPLNYRELQLDVVSG